MNITVSKQPPPGWTSPGRRELPLAFLTWASAFVNTSYPPSQPSSLPHDRNHNENARRILYTTLVPLSGGPAARPPHLQK